MIEPFKCETCSHRAVANNGHNLAVILTFIFCCHGHSQCSRNGGGGMTDTKRVEFAFTSFREPAQALILSIGDKVVTATGENFVSICLVTDIPNELVVRCVVYIM